MSEKSKPSRFVTSLKDDDVIWRYMPFTKYVDFLRTCSIYCARADKFEDPTEGEWVAQLRLLGDDDLWMQNRDTVFARRLLIEKLKACNSQTKAEIARCVDEVVATKFGWTLQLTDDDYDFKTYSETPAQLAEDLEDADLPVYEDVFHDSRPNAKDAPSLYAEIDRVRKSSFISCWHLASDQNIAMWKLYGSGIEAVAVRSTVGKLRAVLAAQKASLEAKGIKGNVTRVQYVDRKIVEDEPDELLKCFDPSDLFFPVTVKHSAYEYEKEVRLILVQTESASPPPAGHHFKVADTSKQLTAFVDAVYLNPMLPSNHWFCELVDYQHKLHGLPNALRKHDLIATEFTGGPKA